MIASSSFLASLQKLSQYLRSGDAELEEVINRAYRMNPWFFPAFTKNAIESMADDFLDVTKVENWLSGYDNPKSKDLKIAIIMAGNVPLVGFHDLFCVLAMGHKAILKLSDKDDVLPKFLVKKWTEFYPELHDKISFTEKLDDFDAVIATGSNNSSRYFEYYFRNKPHILRRNRNGVAVLNGSETFEELSALGNDIFLYYGLGCRNVSKLFVPEGYDFELLTKAIEPWRYVQDHSKYKNNLEYNLAIYIINSVPHTNLGHVILKPDDAIASRIGCVHYEFYNQPDVLAIELEQQQDEIQCIVSTFHFEGLEHLKPGRTQSPGLGQYADGVDTIAFLQGL